MQKRVKSCLVTGFLGDAFGSKFELSDIPTGDDRWGFTDDTQMTVATCESILAMQGMDPKNLGETFMKWYRSGRIKGIGASTLMAMVQMIGGSQLPVHADLPAGNDAAMRIAPLAFLVDPTKPEGRHKIREFCQVTHQQEEAFVAALAVVLAIRVAEPDQLNTIPFVVRNLPDSQVKTRLEQINASPKMTIREAARKYGNGGLAHESIPFALYAASQAAELGIQGMMKAIASTGGDTDTNCAIAGQVAGAALGTEKIPKEWLDKLSFTEGFDTYYDVVRQFAEYVNQQQGIQTLF